jgi:hypothetical protein
VWETGKKRRDNRANHSNVVFMFRPTHRKISPRVVHYLPHGGLYIPYFSILDVVFTFARYCHFNNIDFCCMYLFFPLRFRTSYVLRHKDIVKGWLGSGIHGRILTTEILRPFPVGKRPSHPFASLCVSERTTHEMIFR